MISGLCLPLFSFVFQRATTFKIHRQKETSKLPLLLEVNAGVICFEHSVCVCVGMGPGACAIQSTHDVRANLLTFGSGKLRISMTFPLQARNFLRRDVICDK